METTVRKAELLEILRQNRRAHRGIFEKAVAEYTKRLIEWHRQQERSLLAGKSAERSVRLPQPEDHTDEYDTMIKMMEMEVGSEVTLDFRLFQNLVMDQWSWSGSFAANSTSYTITE